MKNKTPSKLQQAWARFFKDAAVDDLEAYRSDGWKTVDEIATQSNTSLSTIHSRIRRSRNLEWKTITAANSSGVARKVTIARPKLKG
jgi:hypothetical protein